MHMSDFIFRQREVESLRLRPRSQMSLKVRVGRSDVSDNKSPSCAESRVGRSDRSEPPKFRSALFGGSIASGRSAAQIFTGVRSNIHRGSLKN